MATAEDAPAARLGDSRLGDAHLGVLLDALMNSWCLAGIVPLVLDAVARDPLASGGRFAGDIVRGLMEVPGAFWTRHPALYARYQDVLRASAAARRSLPIEQRMQFWAPLADLPQGPVVDNTVRDGATGDEDQRSTERSD